MKVLIVHPQMALYAGAEIVVVRLAHYLQEHGHEVSILTLSTAPHPDYEGLNFILPAEDKRIQYRLRGSIGALWDVLKIYQALQELCTEYLPYYDLVNPHNFPAIWAVSNSKRTVWMCNEVPDLWHGADVSGLANRLFDIGRLADRAIVRNKLPLAVVPDERCAETFYRRYGLKPYIIPYGIEPFDETHREAGPDFWVIQPSMISPSKDQMSTLKAVEQLTPRPTVIFTGYREPLHPYTIQLDKYIASHSLSAVFTGHVSRERLQELYGSVHAAVFPGKGQGSWLGPFEALSAGVPVVISPNLSCSELIAEQGIGIVTDNLAGALQAIRNDYPRYREQALRGREFVLRELTWDAFGARMLEVMET